MAFPMSVYCWASPWASVCESMSGSRLPSPSVRWGFLWGCWSPLALCWPWVSM